MDKGLFKRMRVDYYKRSLHYLRSNTQIMQAPFAMPILDQRFELAKSKAGYTVRLRSRQENDES